MIAGGRFSGQTIVVTGASRGIGRATALTLASEGARVVLAARSLPAVEAAAAQARSQGHRASAIAVDVTSASDLDDMVAHAVDTFGSLDALVANAGVETSATVQRSDPRTWADTVSINLVGSYLSARAVLPTMREQGAGQIVFVGSGAGHSPTPGLSAYGASKAGVGYLSTVLSQEVWRHGINVNEVIPGPVATEMTSDRWTLGESPSALPMERVKSVDEAAAFIGTVLALGIPGGPTGQVFSLARRPW